MTYLERFGYYKTTLIEDVHDDRGRIIVVIPCFNECAVITTLNSLRDSILYSEHYVEIIVVVNHHVSASAEIKRQNQKTIDQILEWKSQYTHDRIALHTISALDLPDKKAGVGLARKIGMDEASMRLAHRTAQDGIIACFDADCTCSVDYITELHAFFTNEQHYKACSIAFAHDISDRAVHRQAITLYELHLRLYINFQKQIGLPFAVHTVGSSMAVNAYRYQSLGGMNTRKAGEDFYFLHKFISNGECGELNTCCIYPSSRISDRVPFGTGRAMGEIHNSRSLSYTSYNIRSYQLYRPFIDMLSDIYHKGQLDISILDSSFVQFLENSKVDQKLDQIRSNTRSFESFKSRFFQTFDAFFFMKYLHYMRDHGLNDMDVIDVARSYLDVDLDDPQTLLQAIRMKDYDWSE